jgi:hypothetical protein
LAPDCDKDRVDDRRKAVRRLHAKALAALGAATGQYQTTTLGSHTSTEAMDTLSVQIAGLVCALHR